MDIIEIYDKNDLKVKHASGEYKNLINAPEPDDMIHYFISSKKKFVIVEDLIKFFGDEKTDKITNSLQFLIDDSLIVYTPKAQNQEIINIITDSKFTLNDR